MNDEERNSVILLVTHGVPAIVGLCLAALILGMPPAWLTLLEEVGHLKSLGKPAEGCQRWFATQYLLKLRLDEEWLDKAVALVRRRFRLKNAQTKWSAGRSRGGTQP